MAAIETTAIKILIYLAPMYFANSTAMVFGGKTPLDFGRNFFDGRRIFGKGKTFKGTFFGIASGIAVAGTINWLFPDAVQLLTRDYISLGILLSFGAIIGDSVASFFKRRNSLDSGTEVLFLDQLDFVFGGMILGSIIYTPNFYEVLYVSAITLVVHKFSNYLAYKIKLKQVPW
ncbi:MAG: hypothetical protein COV47_06120 [Candidatus Diapherotrites archaeon CG11_big_fil_rev_8_21_14_0_20_37_9]|nr:MAG: hypothetical protein COV47_06120 [Candidatus Diapherotrites archaeon CG11_big_fil_rev_8_21_14_0_20_37_9]